MKAFFHFILAILVFLASTAQSQTVTYGPYKIQAQPCLSNTAWRERFEAINATMLAATKTDVIFFGDSITQGFESAPAWYRFKNPINAGIVSDRPEHLLWRIQNGAVAPARLAVVMIGINSVGSNPEATVAAIGAVLQAIHEAWPQTVIVPMALLPARGHKDWVDAINARLRKIYPDLIDIGDKITHDMQPDGLHLNWKGYEVWADEILARLP